MKSTSSKSREYPLYIRFRARSNFQRSFIRNVIKNQVLSIIQRVLNIYI